MLTSRRQLVAGFLLPWVRLRGAWALPAWGPHPAPRPGITAAKVATPAQVADFPEAVDAFDLVTGFEVREMSDKVIARAPRVP